MSIESLTQGDTVVKQSSTVAIGESGGQVPTWSDAGSLTCTIQTPGASETRDYAARGMRLTHWAFFNSDPSLTNGNRLRWTVRAGVTLSVPIYLRVLDCYPEGRPGENMLWVADLEQVTTRPE